MSPRFAKQLIYGTLYIIIALLIVWLGYRVFVPSAATPAPALVIQPIQILDVHAFTASAGYDTFLAKIDNVNSDQAAWSFNFAFNVYDASGTLVASFPGESFAYPNEVKYLVLVNQSIPKGVANFNLTIPTTTANWIASSSYGPLPHVSPESISTQVGSSTVIASGALVDNDTSVFHAVFIVAVFKDANGNPIGASQTQIDSIAPGQTVPFSITYPVVAGINPAATEIEAYAYRQ